MRTDPPGSGSGRRDRNRLQRRLTAPGNDNAMNRSRQQPIEKGASVVDPEPGIECHTFTIVGHCARTGLLGMALASSPLAVAEAA